MSVEALDDDDVYHYDFTTASEWEIFIARLEEIITDWKVNQSSSRRSLKSEEFKNAKWNCNIEKVLFAEVEFQLHHYKLEAKHDLPESTEVQESSYGVLEDLMSMENNFFPFAFPYTSNAHPLSRWYGLREYLVLVPSHSNHVSTESKVKILLSSAFIAVNNTRCCIPFFVQAREPWQFYFCGVYLGQGLKTEFEMVHLRRTLPHCKHLTGLLTLFKSKLDMNIVSDPVIISVRFTYLLKDWTSSSWTQDPPDFDFLGGETLGVSELGRLPFGASFDPVSELYLYVTWPCLIENSVVDSESYTDLEPMQSNNWSVSIKMSDNLACLLTEYYSEFLQLCKNKNTTYELLWDIIDRQSLESQQLCSSLNKITESRVLSLSHVINKATGRRYSKQGDGQKPEGPIPSELLMSFLYYLFPDADKSSASPYPDHLSSSGGNVNMTEDKPTRIPDERLNGLKSVPYDSLSWRLAILMSHVVHSLGGVKSATHLWYEFTQELRYRWERSIFIPGVVSGFPDPRTCLLNQKLQLLNCCIDRKITREKRQTVTSEEESDSEVDEFFDCKSDSEHELDENTRKKVKHLPWDQPTGRLAKHGELKLLSTGEDLYIPITQDPVPKTEDQLEEDAEVLLQLGTDSHGSELRARMMSASLLSDMEAFQAANPGCQLTDFIRWYSPRDWVLDEGLDEFGQVKGHLSSRMQIPGNTWVEVWQAAKPVPARRQKRLFDDTRESEKALNYLESKNPAEYIQLLLPVMTHCVVHRLLEESGDDQLPRLDDVLNRIIKKSERLGRMSNVDTKRYEELLLDIANAETLIVEATSLKRKFLPSLEVEAENANYQKLTEFIREILSKNEAVVPGGPRSGIGVVVKNFFSEAAKAEQMLTDTSSQVTDEKWNVGNHFSTPYEKEFILRLKTSNGPQRLHAVLKKGECRFSGAFTQQDIFC